MDPLAEAQRRADKLLRPGYAPLRAWFRARVSDADEAHYELGSRPLQYTLVIRRLPNAVLAELECRVTNARSFADEVSVLKLTVGPGGEAETMDQALDAVVRAVAERAPLPPSERATFQPFSETAGRVPQPDPRHGSMPTCQPGRVRTRVERYAGRLNDGRV